MHACPLSTLGKAYSKHVITVSNISMFHTALRHSYPPKCQVIIPLSFQNPYYLLPAALSALIVGATGQTGRHLLQSLLASPDFTRVGEYGRNVTSASDIKTGKDKLEQKVINFDKIQEYGLKQGKWDVVFITYVPYIYIFFCMWERRFHVDLSLSVNSLGTTKSNAGSAEAFEKIDRESVQVI